MTIETPQDPQDLREQDAPFRFRLPFLRQPLGFGSAIEQFTDAVGLPQCGGCARRKQKLDKFAEFVPMGWT